MCFGQHTSFLVCSLSDALLQSEVPEKVDYLGQEGEAAEFQIFLERGLEINRTWIIFFLRVLHNPSWPRKLTLQWCMQENQVAVVIIAEKSSQNLPLEDPSCDR